MFMKYSLKKGKDTMTIDTYFFGLLLYIVIYFAVNIDRKLNEGQDEDERG